MNEMHKVDLTLEEANVCQHIAYAKVTAIACCLKIADCSLPPDGDVDS
jgi:hypothetical protein